jgi:hypothetical protein
MIKVIEWGQGESFWRDKFYQSSSEQIGNVDFSRAPDQSSVWSLDFDLLYIRSENLTAAVKKFPALPVKLARTGLIDCVIRRKDSGLWPTCMTGLALTRSLVHAAKHLDLQRAAYIIGANTTAKAAIMELVALGMQKFFLVDPDFSASKSLTESFGRNLFSMEFVPLQNAELPLRPNDGSLLLNTIDLSIFQELAQDLSYLNFISKEGLFIDCFPGFATHTLLDEARHVGLQVIPSSRFWGWFDYLALLEAGASLKVDRDEFLQMYDRALDFSQTTDKRQSGE